jgi:hypothetical protein
LQSREILIISPRAKMLEEPLNESV